MCHLLWVIERKTLTFFKSLKIGLLKQHILNWMFQLPPSEESVNKRE